MSGTLLLCFTLGWIWDTSLQHVILVTVGHLQRIGRNAQVVTAGETSLREDTDVSVFMQL